MPTDERKNGCQDAAGAAVVVVAMTKSNSYMSSASNSSYSTSNAGDCEPASQAAVSGPSSGCLARPSADGRPSGSSSSGQREVHRVKFAEDLNEYLTSDDRHGSTDSLDVDDDGYGGTSRAVGGYGDDVDGYGPHSTRSQQQQQQQRYAQRPSIIKQPRPRSPENHDNPFIADGELHRKADYIIRYSTISRRRIRIADPDCEPPVVQPPQQDPDQPINDPESSTDVVIDDVAVLVDAPPSNERSPTINGFGPAVSTSPVRGGPAVSKSESGDGWGGPSPTGLVNGEVEHDGRLEAQPTDVDRPTMALLSENGKPQTSRQPGGRLRYNCCALQ